VALATENSIAAVVAYWSLAYAGATIVLVDACAPAPERRRLLEMADCRWVAGAPCWAQRQPATGREETGILAISPDGVELIGAPAALRGEPQGAPAAESPADLAVLVPTSGTTGGPKLVMWTHAGLRANCGAHAEVLGLSREDVALVVLSLHYSAAHTTQLLSHTGLGGTLVLDRSPLFTPRRCSPSAVPARPPESSKRSAPDCRTPAWSTSTG
jgi:long-subunit acyl-CoA synthetase (AMP-forming)